MFYLTQTNRDTEFLRIILRDGVPPPFQNLLCVAVPLCET